MKRGFGSPNYDKKKAREAHAKGGKNSPMNFKNNPELAKIAGSKGGMAKKQRDGNGRFIKKLVDKVLT